MLRFLFLLFQCFGDFTRVPFFRLNNLLLTAGQVSLGTVLERRVTLRILEQRANWHVFEGGLSFLPLQVICLHYLMLELATWVRSLSFNTYLTTLAENFTFGVGEQSLGISTIKLERLYDQLLIAMRLAGGVRVLRCYRVFFNNLNCGIFKLLGLLRKINLISIGSIIKFFLNHHGFRQVVLWWSLIVRAVALVSEHVRLFGSGQL